MIRVEDLKISEHDPLGQGYRSGSPGRNVRAKAGLNREILARAGACSSRRLEQKAPGRVEKINPALHVPALLGVRARGSKSRESQARFRCTACGFACNADVNAAMNIAAGHAVTARGGS